MRGDNKRMKKTADISDANVIRGKLAGYFKNRSGVRDVIVFGSFADGTNTKHSDLDIIVIKKTGKRFLDRYKEYQDLDDRIGVSVELFIYTPEEWDIVKKRKFFKNAPMIKLALAGW